MSVSKKAKVPVTLTGFSKLDLDEAKRIAGIVEFDVMACASELGRGCGPGKDYFAQDKRYYMIMLLKHIEGIIKRGEHLPPEVDSWYKKAKRAAREHQQVQEDHLLKRKGKG